MAYTKYTTRGFLLGSVPFGEADKVFFFFTEEFGYIKAIAKSIRKEGAKLQNALVACALLHLTVVSGKEIWRVIEVVKEEELFLGTKEFETFLKNLVLLKSLVHGEEKNLFLFQKITEGFNTLLNLPKEQESIGILISFFIVHALGYGRDVAIAHSFLEASSFEDVLFLVKEYKVEISRIVNQGILASQL